MIRFLQFLPFVLSILLVRCKCEEASHRDNLVNATYSTDRGVVLQDSIVQAIPTIPNKYLTEEENMWKENGIELPRNDVELLLKANLGLIMPKGFPLDSSDLKTRYLPATRLYIVGKWLLSADIDTYIVKVVNVKDMGSISFYLMSVKEKTVLDAIYIAFVAKEYNQFCPGPRYAERMDDHTVRTIFLDLIGEIDSEIYYKVAPNGTFKIVNRVQRQHFREDDN